MCEGFYFNSSGMPSVLLRTAHVEVSMQDKDIVTIIHSYIHQALTEHEINAWCSINNIIYVPRSVLGAQYIIKCANAWCKGSVLRMAQQG